ncbi:uncharacterized protein BXZ73DRAFT_100199 [Epithele typhae]|uniref:uncharacterized protein n=1 Tax=Epithele typhae TaxID=378194 RepID=UPI0020078A45|nr:uncharacterized protein BXZ73DRAFT_100199 [Epithele typhae]KAH9936777.1 hypothetical protein BXZ73DRAFT_100199 [Epithele typhae]
MDLFVSAYCTCLLLKPHLQSHHFSDNVDMNVVLQPLLPVDVLIEVAGQCDSDYDIVQLMNTCRIVNERASLFLHKGRQAHVRSIDDLRLLTAFLGAQDQERWRRLSQLSVEICTEDSIDRREQVQALLGLFRALQSAPALRVLEFDEVELYLALDPALATALTHITSITTLKLTGIGPDTLRFLEGVSWGVHTAQLDLSPDFLAAKDPHAPLPKMMFHFLRNMSGTLRELDLGGSRNGMFSAASDLRFSALQSLNLSFAVNEEFNNFFLEAKNVMSMFPKLSSLEMHAYHTMRPYLDPEEVNDLPDNQDPEEVITATAAWQNDERGWKNMALLDAPLVTIFGLGLQRPVDEIRTAFEPPDVGLEMLPLVLELLNPRSLALHIYSFDTLLSLAFPFAFHPGQFTPGYVSRLTKLDLTVLEDTLKRDPPQYELMSLLDTLGWIVNNVRLEEMRLMVRRASKPTRLQVWTRPRMRPSKSPGYAEVVTTRMHQLLRAAPSPTLEVMLAVRCGEEGDEDDELGHTFYGFKPLTGAVTVGVQRWNDVSDEQLIAQGL